MTTFDILVNAKNAKKEIATLSTKKKNEALLSMADALEENIENILNANKYDIENATGISSVMLDRLTLTKQRILAMSQGIRDVVALPDPCGNVIESFYRGNLHISKVSVPLGVIAIIYESRPNVTSDAAALTFKSGNACVLRGGKEAFNTSNAIICAMKSGLSRVGVNENIINLVLDTSRQSATELMTAVGFVDLLIPRGGAGLIKNCVENAKVPCVQTGSGICHIYIDEFADVDMALNIVENAKCSRPSVCNAMEVCLVNKKIANEFLPKLYNRIVESRAKYPVELHCDDSSFSILGEKNNVVRADSNDFDTEFLDYKMAVKVVDSVEDACEHIALHSTTHSESIVTNNKVNADYFLLHVDSAAVYVNASTRFTDGGEFGMGCEIGISTQKMHARGPMGLKELTSYKYTIVGNGDIR